MKDVEHFTPETLDEAAALLMAAEIQASPLAEGTVCATPVQGSRTASIVIDLARIPELNRLDYDERNGLRVGTAVAYATLLEFPPVRRLYPILADGCSLPGPAESRERATFGASLGRAVLPADVVSPLICLRASAAIYGPHGWSELGIEALFAEAGRIALQPGEFLVDVRLPAPPPRSSGAYLRSHPPEGIGWVQAGVGAFLVMEDDLITCCGARLVLSRGSERPDRALEAERFLAGKRLEGPVLDDAGGILARIAHLGSTEGACTEKQREAVRALTRRAILEALGRARTAVTP